MILSEIATNLCLISNGRRRGISQPVGSVSADNAEVATIRKVNRMWSTQSESFVLTQTHRIKKDHILTRILPEMRMISPQKQAKRYFPVYLPFLVFEGRFLSRRSQETKLLTACSNSRSRAQCDKTTNLTPMPERSP